MKNTIIVSLLIVWVLSFVTLLVYWYNLCMSEIKSQEEWNTKFVRKQPLAPLKPEDIIDLRAFEKLINYDTKQSTALSGLVKLV